MPSNPYAASKSAQEAIVCSYWRTFGLPIMTCVTMNMFGERQHPEKLIPKTVKYLLNGDRVPIHAEQRGNKWIAGSRTWLHARNFSDSLLFLLNNIEPQQFPDFEFPSKFNVSGDKELTNLEIVYKIAEVMGVEPLYEFTDFHKERPGHDRRYALNGDKLIKLGWKPPLSFEESFKKTIKWMAAPKNKEWLY